MYVRRATSKTALAPISRLYDELIKLTKDYLEEGDLKHVKDAYEFARKAHEGQRRRSGMPYIEHPLNTAVTLARLRQPSVTLCAALLHDVLEDCNVKPSELREKFGATTTSIVEGVTKLQKLQVADSDDPRNEINAYNLRKLFVSMARDVRVVLVKLADRLHNIQTLKYLNSEQQYRIARETMEVYAPIAHRLGIASFRWQLEDGAFKYLMPDKYRAISRRVARRRKERERTVTVLESRLKKMLAKHGIGCRVSGRPKHLYGIYRKAGRYEKQGREFSDIYDLMALRVVIDGTTSDCYKVFNLVHELWKPIPGQFDDYIANPKANYYRSLHTAAIGPHGHPFEIQIRTDEMNRDAEEGIAAHWGYSENVTPSRDMWFERALTDLKHSLLENEQETLGDAEVVDTIKGDLSTSRILVFTPKGDVVELVEGATVLDFAYRVHTDLGHSSTGARVNGAIVKLNHTLKNGDIIEIRKSRSLSAPRQEWLNPRFGYLKTNTSRSKVRAWFRSHEREASLAIGRNLLKREKRELGLAQTDDEIAKWLNFENGDALAIGLAQGEVTSDTITQKAIPKMFPDLAASNGVGGNSITHAIVVPEARDLTKKVRTCCDDISHGEPLSAYITNNKELAIHRPSCRNLQAVGGKNRIVEALWRATHDNQLAHIRIVGANRVGLIRDITSELSAEQASISSIFSDDEKRPERDFVSVTIALYAMDTGQLGRVIARIRAIHGVSAVIRYNETETEQEDAKQENTPSTVN